MILLNNIDNQMPQEDEKIKLINEAKRIKEHSLKEYEKLEATLDDGLRQR